MCVMVGDGKVCDRASSRAESISGGSWVREVALRSCQGPDLSGASFYLCPYLGLCHVPPVPGRHL